MHPKEREKFVEYRRQLGVFFNDIRILKQAFIHRSFLNENRELKKSDSNERLEFLGDSVIQLAITDFLYRKYPNHQEGPLTQFRSAMVNTTLFADIAKNLGMKEYLLMSTGFTFEGSTEYRHILADVFEAFIGALYLDQGYNSAHDFLSKHLFPRINEIMEKKLWRDSKSLFQEKAQKHASTTPVYKILHESGVPHDKTFTVVVMLGKDFVAEGEGKSLKEAEREAAEEGLRVKNWID